MRSQQIPVPRRCPGCATDPQQRASGGFGVVTISQESVLSLSPSQTCCFPGYNQSMPVLLNFLFNRINPKDPKI